MEEVIFDGWASSTEKIVQSFKAAFMDTINELCPVRTGYLISSIHCDGSDTEIDCYAEAEYA